MTATKWIQYNTAIRITEVIHGIEDFIRYAYVTNGKMNCSTKALIKYDSDGRPFFIDDADTIHFIDSFIKDKRE